MSHPVCNKESDKIAIVEMHIHIVVQCRQIQEHNTEMSGHRIGAAEQSWFLIMEQTSRQQMMSHSALTLCKHLFIYKGNQEGRFSNLL